MKHQTRKQLLIDGGVQLPIMLRIVAYWFFCLTTVTCALTLARVDAEPDVFFLSQLFHVVVSYWPVYAVMFAGLPIALYDALKLSNRFAGPVYRMKTNLRDFNDGKLYSPVCLREGDFHSELATEINIAIETARENINADGGCTLLVHSGRLVDPSPESQGEELSELIAKL